MAAPGHLTAAAVTRDDQMHLVVDEDADPLRGEHTLCGRRPIGVLVGSAPPCRRCFRTAERRGLLPERAT